MSIIDSDIKALVRAIEAPGLTTGQINRLLTELVARVKLAVARPEVKLRYDNYKLPRAEEKLQAMPLDERGYLAAYDILEEEAAFYQAWHQYGIVASRSAVPAEVCEEAVATAHRLTLALSNGACDLDKPETWRLLPRDKSGEPILTRGFFELYHDRALAALRQAVRIYLHYVVIWGRAELWTTFDRLGIKLPGHEESRALPLHVDQNPNVHPDFRTVQGVLALRDCPSERGTFVGVPGSRQHFQAYGAMAKNSGEYVELDTASAAYGLLAPAVQACPLAQGSLVSWDSRTTHANSANLSALTLRGIHRGWPCLPRRCRSGCRQSGGTENRHRQKCPQRQNACLKTAALHRPGGPGRLASSRNLNFTGRACLWHKRLRQYLSDFCSMPKPSASALQLPLQNASRICAASSRPSAM